MGGSPSVLISFSLSFELRIRNPRVRPPPADPVPVHSGPLSPAQVRALPVLLIPHRPADGGGGKGCSVCLDDFSGGQEVRILPRCRHAFHRRCIDPWLLRSGRCPVCRDRPVHVGLASIIQTTADHLPL